MDSRKERLNESRKAKVSTGFMFAIEGGAVWADKGLIEGKIDLYLEDEGKKSSSWDKHTQVSADTWYGRVTPSSHSMS